jgi:short-subunit dehydrogenase
MEASEAATRPLAVVTGASSGIGRALAGEFARNGFDLVVAAEDTGIADTAEELRAALAHVTPVQVDLADFDGVERLVQSIQETGRPVDALAVNAGVGLGGDFVRETELEAELRLIALNVMSSVHLAKRLLPAMLERGAGRVLFTSSIAGTGPGPYEATYAASKAFLYSFAEAIRYELRDSGVSVTALLPGPTDTQFFQRAGMQDTKIAEMDKADPADVAREGYEALMAGKDHVIAGSLRDKIQASAGKGMPEPMKAKAHAAMSEPESGATGSGTGGAGETGGSGSGKTS